MAFKKPARKKFLLSMCVCVHALNVQCLQYHTHHDVVVMYKTMKYRLNEQRRKQWYFRDNRNQRGVLVYSDATCK